ncbi:SpoIVB peptidase [Huintestinicola sp.]|uniref:SpoIVB peptidase n=1 Tax=Huintestinicola sp. TaxID=2981661 RepID=UPI003D7D343C
MNFALKMFRSAACTALAALTGSIIYYNCALPDNYCVAKGGSLVINDHIEVRSDRIIPESYDICTSGNAIYNASSMKGAVAERTEQLRLFGIFPIKNVNVTEVNEPVVVPCGTPFGIKLLTKGVLVVELTGFDNGGGVASPAREAGINEGDIIISISGKPVSSNKDVSRIIGESGGKTLGVELVRDGESRVVFLKPDKSAADDCYHAGMWVRDSSAGIGTVTFYDPTTKMFAGLGHPVCDSDTGEMLTMSSGEAADVYISGIKKSSAGSPGELIGMFTSDKSCGSLVLNSESGIYGYMDKCPSIACAVPVAMRQEIKTGPAVIYATVDGSSPKEYSVEIEKIDLKGAEAGKNMVVRITDDRLLDKAGGIVQGMSGSPIIQDGRLVGAVTHVFVRDPTRGYAIFADTMLECAENAAG